MSFVTGVQTTYIEKTSPTSATASSVWSVGNLCQTVDTMTAKKCLIGARTMARQSVPIVPYLENTRDMMFRNFTIGDTNSVKIFFLCC